MYIKNLCRNGKKPHKQGAKTTAYGGHGMNQDQFKRYIAVTRDCDSVLIDIAVNKGMLRAKSERLDFKKIINLAAIRKRFD